MKLIHWIMIVPLFWLMIGCDSSAPGTTYSGIEDAPPETEDKAKPAQPGDNVDRKIIYEITLNLKVNDLSEAATRIGKLVDEQKGYIASSDISGVEEYRRSGSWVVRVPVATYQTFLNDVKSLGTVTQEVTTAQDVTEQYLDLEARLKNKRVEEERLVEHLKKSTGKLEEILAVEKELSRVREEIETGEGKFRLPQKSNRLYHGDAAFGRGGKTRLGGVAEFRPESFAFV